MIFINKQVKYLSMLRDIKYSVGLATIKFFRKLFLNTPLNKSRITGIVREWIYKSVVKSEEIEIPYMGIRLRAPSHDLGLVPGLIGGYYEKAEVTIFKSLSKKAKSIIDIGGNIGLYAIISAKHMPETGKVVTFEPVPENIRFLKMNVALNKVDHKVNIEPFAVGDSSGFITLYLSQKSIGNHSAGIKNVGSSSDKKTVQKVSIDYYITEHGIDGVDILKIDTEGYDFYALLGAYEAVKKYKPTLFLEFIPNLIKNCGSDPDDFSNLLFELYKKCFVVNELSGKIREVKQDNFFDFTRNISNANLILSSQKVHLDLLKKFMV